MELDQDFNEFLQLFLDNGIRFMIVGGYAMAAHGLPRFTGVLEAWVWISKENSVKIVSALHEFGFGSINITPQDFESPNLVIQLGYAPNRIDLLTGIDGVNFDDAWERRLLVDINGLEIPFIGRDDLIKNKKSAGRPQDLADVTRLEQ